MNEPSSSTVFCTSRRLMKNSRALMRGITYALPEDHKINPAQVDARCRMAGNHTGSNTQTHA
ncbi:MAG: hypothetical protein MZU97_17920 [Bacillus subtilis]|nr:hypothetical protein [Bacillus subtilis]